MTYVEVVERKVIDMVIGLFSSPEDLNVLLKNARAEARKELGDKISERSKLEGHLGELNREVEKLTDLLMYGIGVEEVLDERVKAAYAKKTEIENKLADLGNEQPENVIDIHPAALKKVLICATELRAMMERGDMEGDHALSEAFRFFLDSVVVHKADGWRKEPTVEIRSPWMAFSATPLAVRATASGLSGGLMVEGRGPGSDILQLSGEFIGNARRNQDRSSSRLKSGAVMRTGQSPPVDVVDVLLTRIRSMR